MSREILLRSDPDLDLATYAEELVELFVGRIRADPEVAIEACSFDSTPHGPPSRRGPGCCGERNCGAPGAPGAP